LGDETHLGNESWIAVPIDTVDDELSEGQHKYSTGDFFAMWAQKWLYSRYNYTVWVLLVILNIFTVYWTIHHHYSYSGLDNHYEWWFVALEVMLNIAMCIDILVRYCVLGRAYFDDSWNVLDILVLSLCTVATMYTVLEGCGIVSDYVVLADETLLVLRSTMCVIKCVFLNNKRVMGDAAHTPIKFSMPNMNSAFHSALGGMRSGSVVRAHSTSLTKLDNGFSLDSWHSGPLVDPRSAQLRHKQPEAMHIAQDLEELHSCEEPEFLI